MFKQLITPLLYGVVSCIKVIQITRNKLFFLKIVVDK